MTNPFGYDPRALMREPHPIEMLYSVGPLEFWLYEALHMNFIVGPAVLDAEGSRIGQLVVRIKK